MPLREFYLKFPGRELPPAPHGARIHTVGLCQVSRTWLGGKRMDRGLTTAPGSPYPLGATLYPRGVNLALFSRNARAVELLLFDRCDDPEPAVVLP